MATQTDDYGSDERIPDEVILWSRFPDVIGLWTVLGWEPQPKEVA